MEAHYYRALKRYHFLLKGKKELDNLGLPPAEPQSLLKAKIQDLEQGATRSAVFSRSDILSAPNLHIEFNPQGSNYDTCEEIKFVMGLNAYGRLRQQGSVRLAHSLGELLVEA